MLLNQPFLVKSPEPFKLLKKNYIDLNTFVHSKECIETVGFFDETLKRLVDGDYIIRITAMYEPVFVPEVLVNYYLNICGDSIAITEREDIALKAIRKKNIVYTKKRNKRLEPLIFFNSIH